MERQTLVFLPSGYGPARHDSPSTCQFGLNDSLNISQTENYSSEVRINTYSWYLDLRVLTTI